MHEKNQQNLKGITGETKMYIAPNLAFLSMIFFALCAAGGWGILYGEYRQRNRLVFAEPGSKNINVQMQGGHWHTVEFPKVPTDSVQDFIHTWEKRGFMFGGTTRSNGDSYTTVYMKQYIIDRKGDNYNV